MHKIDTKKGGWKNKIKNVVKKTIEKREKESLGL